MLVSYILLIYHKIRQLVNDVIEMHGLSQDTTPTSLVPRLPRSFLLCYVELIFSSTQLSHYRNNGLDVPNLLSHYDFFPIDIRRLSYRCSVEKMKMR